MKKRKPTTRLNITLSDEDYQSLIMEAKVARRGSMKMWVHQAIREKLGRPQSPDPMGALTASDRASVALYVELLEAMPEDGDLRAAVDGVLSLASRARGR